MPVLNLLPAGNNKCIGSYANESAGKLYSFIYNSNGDHTITEYDNNLNNISIVLQGSYLNFGEYDCINGCSIAGDNLLYWTDGVNPPRSIDITKAKSGEYYTDSVSISLAKPPPQRLIQAQYNNDPVDSTTSNRLKSQLFQFRYLYVYEDNSRSAWSSISSLPYPNLEVNNSVNTASYRNNSISIQFDSGTKYVKSVEIATLAQGALPSGQTNDWYTILTVDRSDLISNPLYEYDAVYNTAVYKFYNDGLYQSVDIKEVDLPYDFVPLKSKTLDIVNGNVLVLGNNTEGYNNLPDDGIELSVDLSVTYDPNIPNRLNAFWVEYNLTNILPFWGVPVAGDQIVWSYDLLPKPGPEYNFTYTVTDETSGSLYDTVLAYMESVNTLSLGRIVMVDPVISNDPYVYGDSVSVTVTNPLNPEFGPGYYFCINGIAIIPDESFSGTNTNAGYKTNSRYEFGLVYYDEFNRSSYVQTNNQFTVATQSWGAVSGRIPVINWSVSHNPPEWATKYQWVRTEQLTHRDFLFWSASSVTANPQNPTELYDLNINSLSAYNEKNPNSILSYDYTAGDRCTIHQQDGNWVTGYDVEVVGFEPDSGVLTIQKKSTPALSASVSGILLEIYTPKTRANSTQEKFFYEFGECYSCVAVSGVNKHSLSAGTFRAGDIYDKGRIISGVNYQLEDPNYSDFYVSNFSSNGRTNIFAPQAKQLTLPTDIRFSDTYVPNTNINGLSRFYGDAFETYDRVNGSIQKLAVRDNYLMTFQELKTGYIPILQSIIEDQGAGNTANVAISNKLLNKIRYFPGDYGIGLNPESFARYAGTMYFMDPNRGFALKLVQGLQTISTIGMNSYFTNKLSSVRTIPNMKLLGSYDPRNDEYIVTFKYPPATGTSETVAFNENINRWTSFYSFTPEHADYIFNKYMAFNNGIMWEHNSSANYNTFYGTQYPSIVQLTYNGSPLLVKSFIGLMEQSNTVWYPSSNVVSSKETAITTSLGQTSNLLSDDFTKKEGVWFSSLMRDIESPGGINDGDDLKGNWIKFRLVNNPTERVSLLSADLTYIPSYQGIK
jgi:hypothetical protein